MARSVSPLPSARRTLLHPLVPGLRRAATRLCSNRTRQQSCYHPSILPSGCLVGQHGASGGSRLRRPREERRSGQWGCARLGPAPWHAKVAFRSPDFIRRASTWGPPSCSAGYPPAAPCGTELSRGADPVSATEPASTTLLTPLPTPSAQIKDSVHRSAAAAGAGSGFNRHRYSDDLCIPYSPGMLGSWSPYRKGRPLTHASSVARLRAISPTIAPTASFVCWGMLSRAGFMMAPRIWRSGSARSSLQQQGRTTAAF